MSDPIRVPSSRRHLTWGIRSARASVRPYYAGQNLSSKKSWAYKCVTWEWTGRFR